MTSDVFLCHVFERNVKLGKKTALSPVELETGTAGTEDLETGTAGTEELEMGTAGTEELETGTSGTEELEGDSWDRVILDSLATISSRVRRTRVMLH